MKKEQAKIKEKINGEKMIIYIDVYFFKNLIFNFLLLYLTKFLIRRKARWYRILLASLLGSVYAVLALYSEKIFESSLLKILMAVGMLMITFGKKQMMNTVTSFGVLVYLIAGIIASLLNVPEKIILLFFAISMLFLFWLYRRKKEESLCYEIHAYFMGREMDLMAKLDTGNELKDHLFGEAVIVANEEKIREELPEDLIAIMKNERLKIPAQYQNRMKLISFQTISGEGIKIGIKLDKIFLQMQGKAMENQAILVLSEQKIRNYDALIGPNLLEGCFEAEEVERRI